jgi:AraC-like DNA-binding protein
MACHVEVRGDSPFRVPARPLSTLLHRRTCIGLRRTLHRGGLLARALHLHTDGPDKPQQLSADSGDDFLLGFTFAHQSAVSLMKSMLRFPGDLPNHLVGVTCCKRASRRRAGKLELTDQGLKAIAKSAGFSSVDLMRRAFVRVLGITPSRYRETIAAGSRRLSSAGSNP